MTDNTTLYLRSWLVITEEFQADNARENGLWQAQLCWPVGGEAVVMQVDEDGVRIERDDDGILHTPFVLQVVSLHGDHVWVRCEGVVFARTRGQFLYDYEAARRFWWYDIALTEAETRKIEQGNAILDSGRSLFAARLDAMLDNVIVVMLDDEGRVG